MPETLVKEIETGQKTPESNGIYAKYIKYPLDFFVSFCAVTVLSPILLILTIVGTIVMRGNPFFIQKRPGKINAKIGKEKIFKLIKFRTMTHEKDKDGKLLPDEQRLTSYGNFLRHTSLDELPELLNVLKGDMSLIGPRPLLIEYLPYYTETERHRHDIRPGLTGLAQINGRNTITWEEKFSLDLEYITNITFLSDMKIFWLTIKKSFIKVEGIELNREGNLAQIRKEKAKSHGEI